MTKQVLRAAAMAATLALGSGASIAGAVLLSEGFDNVAALSGWTNTNASTPTAVGTAGWFQGQPASSFDAQAGAANAYAASNFAIVSGPGGAGHALARLSTPTLALSTGTHLTFWTRSADSSVFPDGMNVLVALTGGLTSTVLSINPGLAAGGYPDAGWAFYDVFLPSQGAGATGRFVFAYDILDTGTSGNYVGLDSVTVSVPEPGQWALLGLGLGLLCLTTAKRRKA